MNKLIFGFFLSFCLLLFSGFEFLCAQTSSEQSLIATLAQLNKTESAYLRIEKGQTFLTTSPIHDSGKSNEIRFTEKEIEEDEITSHRKFLGSSDILAAILCALSLGYFYRYIKKRLASSKRFSDILSYRLHLFLQVFTI
jgi:hypothetical protein